MEGFLQEVEMTYYGQGERRTWWDFFVVLEKMFGKKAYEEEEQNIAIRGVHGHADGLEVDVLGVCISRQRSIETPVHHD